jgi:hypothetical protein
MDFATYPERNQLMRYIHLWLFNVKPAYLTNIIQSIIPPLLFGWDAMKMHFSSLGIRRIKKCSVVQSMF